MYAATLDISSTGCAMLDLTTAPPDAYMVELGEELGEIGRILQDWFS